VFRAVVLAEPPYQTPRPPAPNTMQSSTPANLQSDK